MELVILALIIAAMYGVRSGYRGMRQAARTALTQWAEGNRPESTWGRRAGVATGGFAWAAVQGARGFKNSFGPGFWEGAQRVAEWAEAKELIRPAAKARVGKHIADHHKRRAQKVSMVKPQRVATEDAPPARPPVPPEFLAPPAPAAGDWIDDASATKPVPLIHSKTPARTEGAPVMAAETTVPSLREFLASLKADFTAVADESSGAYTMASDYYKAATTAIDGATESGFQNDITGPITAVAESIHAYQQATEAAAIAAAAVLDSATQGETELSKHEALVDAASGLTGGTAAMADSAAYQDA